MEELRTFGRKCDRNLAIIGALSELDAMISLLDVDPSYKASVQPLNMTQISLLSRLQELREDFSGFLSIKKYPDDLSGIFEEKRCLMDEGKRIMKVLSSAREFIVGGPWSRWLATLRDFTEMVNVAESLKEEARNLLARKRQSDPSVTPMLIVDCLFRAKADMAFRKLAQTHVPEIRSRILEYRDVILQKRAASRFRSDYLNALHFGEHFHAVDVAMKTSLAVGRHEVVDSLAGSVVLLLKAAELLEA